MKQQPPPVTYLKQVARKIKREEGITHLQSLDKAAISFGFNSYQHYKNELESYHKALDARNAQGFELMLEDKRRNATKVYNLKKQQLDSLEFKTLDFFETLKGIKKTKKSIQSECSKNLKLNQFINLSLSLDFLIDEYGDIEDFAPYHILNDLKLKGVEFTFKEGNLYAEGEYEMNLEFAFKEENEDNRGFEDQSMFGDFEIQIDENNQITFIDESIGWDN